jgi:hypothetical protein
VSATEESQAEAVDAAPPAPAETTPDFTAPLPADQEVPQRTVAERSTSPDSDVARAAQARNAICGCCGTNGFLHEELFKIDSGQLLCPRCLDAFRDKADQT